MTKLRTLLTTSLVALSGVLAVPAGAFAADDAAGSRAEAKETLAEAERALDGRGLDTGRELTPLLLELSRELPALGLEERKEARSLLARPTDGAADPQGSGYATGTTEAPPLCNSHFCVHYVVTTADAPDLTDGPDAGSTPDYVDAMAAEFEFVYAREIGELGWRVPKSDGTLGGDVAKTDVYIKDLGPGLYGYAATDRQPVSDNTAYAYQVMDDDYASFSATPEGRAAARRVTAAHEFNHVLQYAYDVFEDTWMFESTATWMEDRVYDEINDYRQYLGSWAQATEEPLTCPNDNDTALPDSLPNCPDRAKIYGSAVWNQWLEGERQQQVPRGAWEQSTAAGSFAPFAYARALTTPPAPTDDGALSAAFASAFAEFSTETAEWQALPAKWEEGSSYPPVERLGALDATSRAPASPVLDHTTFAHFDVTGAGAEPVTLTATLPTGLRGAIALIERTGADPTGGAVTNRITPLPNGGAGTVTLTPSANAGRITAVLVNADLSVDPSRDTDGTQDGYDRNIEDYVWARDDQPFTASISSGTPPDVAPPDTTITSGPESATQERAPRFEFTSSEGASSSFECSLDGAAFAACQSPQASQPLADGSHTFQVRAIDAAGNVDPSPASRSFTVFTPPPDADADGVPDSSDACPTQPAGTLDGCPPPIVDRTPPLAPLVSASRIQSLRRRFVAVACTLREPGACRAIATVTIPRTSQTARKVFRIPAMTRPAAAGIRMTFRLRLSAPAVRAITRALARRVRVTANVTVTATDVSGNRSSPQRRTVRFKR